MTYELTLKPQILRTEKTLHYVNSQNTAKLILYPRVRNSITHLTIKKYVRTYIFALSDLGIWNLRWGGHIILQRNVVKGVCEAFSR